ALAVVVIVQAPWGEGDGKVWQRSRYHTPRLAWILWAAEESDVHTSLPEGLLLGHGHLGLPDRGGVERGRQGPVNLGHLRPHAGQDQERRHRRRRQRPLPPVKGGREADEGPGRDGLPVLHLLAAHLPRGHWAAERQGPRLLQPAGGRAEGGRHRAVRHALPLGPAAGAAGQE